jgi:hypothetical protein
MSTAVLVFIFASFFSAVVARHREPGTRFAR